MSKTGFNWYLTFLESDFFEFLIIKTSSNFSKPFRFNSSITLFFLFTEASRLIVEFLK